MSRLSSAARLFLAAPQTHNEGKSLIAGGGREDPARRSAGEVIGLGTGASSGGRFGQRAARTHLEAYAGQHDAIDWVMDCCNLVGGVAATAPWSTRTVTGTTKPYSREVAEKGERIVPADLRELLDDPNPWMSYGDLITLTFIDELLTGDAFWYLYGRGEDSHKPLAIYRLSPALVEVVAGTGSELITGYKYEVPGLQPVEFDAEDVIHFKRPNPHNMYRGAGLIAGGPRVYDGEIALTNTKAQYFEHGAKLSGVLESERTMTDTAIQKLRRQFMGSYAGSDNAFKVAVLERGLKFTPISATAVEAEFGAMSEQSRDRIFAAFGIPKSMFGIEAHNRPATGQSAEDRREFANTKMRPELDRFQHKISRQLVEPGWGEEFKIDYEYEMPIEDKLVLAEKLAVLPGVTVGEIREFVDLPLLGDARDEIALNLPGENDNESEVKDQPLAGEAGRKPKGENTAELPVPDEAGKTELPSDAAAQTAP